MKAHVGTRSILVLAVLILAANAAAGQAGRRLPKPGQTPPASQPTPEPTPPPKPAAKPEFTLKVMSDITMSARSLFPFPEHMQTWVVDRLKKSQLLDVSAGAQMNRSEAVKLAKAETQAFIIWVQLEDTLLADP